MSRFTPESDSSMEQNAFKVSIVVPSYNEEDNVKALYAELMKVLPSVDATWEIIFADDGSSDGTWQEIEHLHAAHEQVKGIRLSRNFGHQHALFAGLLQATGDVVITMDADLQHPPRVIPQLLSCWRQGFQIVHTVRLDSKNMPILKKATSKLFYRVFSLLSGVKLESGMADFRLLDRKVVDQIIQFREGQLFLRGLVQWVGYTSATISYQSEERFGGTSKYTYKKMIRFATGGITSFSLIPLRISLIIGVITAMASFGELFYVIYIRVFTDTSVPGWASVAGIMSFLFGVLFILIGVIGEYLGQALLETKRRPRFLISDNAGISDPVEDTP